MPAASGGAVMSVSVDSGGEGDDVGALKGLVIGMGVLIVAGTVALAVLLVQRLGGPAAGSAPTSLSLAQPEGARIAGIAASDKAISVWVARPDGERVIVLDPTGARRIGEVRLRD
jgi:hypothetical protein